MNIVAALLVNGFVANDEVEEGREHEGEEGGGAAADEVEDAAEVGHCLGDDQEAGHAHAAKKAPLPRAAWNRSEMRQL